MIKEIILDIETKETFNEVGEYNPELLHLSLVGTYISEIQEYRAFREEQLNKLWPYLERADRVVGYNIKGFDWPVLKKYYPGKIDHIPTLDIMEIIKDIIGFRLKLDSLARANLKFTKSGHGLMAVEYYRKGEWNKLEKYCLDDVRVTKEIYEKGKKDSMLYYLDKLNNKKPIVVNFQPHDGRKNKPLNYTLPL